MDFKDKILHTLKYMSPEEQAKMKISYTPKPEETALLVIDVQSLYADPKRDGDKDTDKIADKIKSIMPAFRKAGIPIYVVYFAQNAYRPHTPAQMELYKIEPTGEDVLVAKEKNSAFAGSRIAEHLKADNRKLLLTCGFNYSACVYETAMDGRKQGFDVAVLRDLTENDKRNKNSEYWNYTKSMAKKGVFFPSAQDVLQAVKQPAPKAP